MLNISTTDSKRKQRKNKGGLLGGLGYVGGSIAAGIGGIGEGIIDVASAGIALLGGDTEYAKYVFKDNVVGDWHQSLTESYNPTGVMQFIGDVGQGIGQSATMLIPYVGVPAFFAGVMSQGISGAAAKTGDVGFKEVAYGVTTGAIEGALESVLGAAGRGAKSIGSAIAKSGGKSAVKSIFSTAARKGLVREILSSAAGEFFEEAASEVIDVGLQRMYKIDPNAKTTLKDVLYAGVIGAVSGAVMGGAVQIPQTVNHRARGQKIIQDGNAQTLINTATSVADKLAGQGTNFKKAPEWVKTLRGEVDAYNKLKPDEKLGAKGQTILGEMHASLFYAETQAVHHGLTEAIKASSEENRATLAEYINQTVDKKNRPRDYTAEDIAKNTDDIATQLAIMQFAGNFFDYDSAIADMAQEQGIVDVVNAMHTEAQEQAAAAQAEQGAEVNLTAEAIGNQANAGIFDASAGVSTEGEVAKSDLASPLTDAKYSVATAKRAQKRVKENAARAERARQARLDEEGRMVESTNQEQSAERKNEPSPSPSSDGATSSEAGGNNEPKIRKPKEEILTDEQRRERARERAKKLIEWEKKTSPTVKELNDAREYVKNFDSLPAKMQTSVIRMIRSAEGKVDKKIVKAVANLMTLRRRNGSLVTPDLEFRFAEGIGDRGLYTHVGNRTLVLINADTDFKNTIRSTIAHELVHYIENKQGYGALALYARRTTRPEAIAKIEKEYNEHYKAVYTAEEEVNGLRGDALKKKVAERMATEEHKELIDSEIVARIVGDRMTNEKFLQRYAQKDDAMIKKLARFLKGAIAELKNKDKETTTILYDMTRLFDNALAGPTVKNSSGTKTAKHSFAGVKAKTADKLKLATAQKMLESGVDSETVRKETGWFKGYDGKWRFEIDDFESSLIENPNLERHEDDGEVYFTGKLSDIFDHKELFEAYPELKNINIVIQTTEFGIDAIYQPKSNYITLSREHFKRYTKAYNEYLNGGRKTEIEQIEQTPEFKEYNQWYDDEIADNMEPLEWLEVEKAARDKFFSSDLGKRYYQLKYSKDGFTGEKFELGWDKGAKEVILHELQHAVQNIEGFASGTNTRDKNYDKSAGEIEAFDTGRRANLTAEQRKNTRPDIDREDVVFANNISVSYFAKNVYDEEIANIKPQLQHAQDRLNAMEVVFSGRITQKFENDHGKTNLKKWAISELQQYGYEADRQGFGKILFPERAIEDAVGHIKSQDEALAIIALYRVLKRGIKIAEHGDHKKRQKHTITIAAPIEINGVRGNMGVVVNLTNNKYYVHRIVLPDGSAFKFDIKKDTNQEMRKGVPNGSLADATRSVSNNSIAQKSDLSTDSAKKVVEKRDLAPKKSTESADKGDAAYERAKGQMYKREADEARKQTAEARRDAMSLAQQIARDAYETDAKTFTQKEIDALIGRINQYSTDEFKDIMDEKKATISKIDKEQFAYDIYVAFHLASADKRVMDRMNVLADRLARQYLDDVFYTDNGKRVYLKDVFDEDTYKKYVNTFRRKIIASFKQMGRETTHARLTAKYRAELAKLQNKLLDAETKGKNLRELQWQAKQLRTSVDIQKRSPQDEGIYNVEKEMSRIADERGRVSAKQADKAFERFYVFLTSDSEKADSSLAEMAQVEGESLVALLEDYKKLRKGHENQYLNSQEMAVAAKIIAGGRKILREYNRVFYNGHWVDMAQLAEETVNDLTSFSGAKKEYKTKLGEWFDTQVNKRFLQGTYFYNILSPETVIETLEGFKKNGVLTTLYHAVREATQRSEHMAVRLKKPFSEFLDNKENAWTDDNGKKHSFRNKLNKKMINVNGAEITLGEAIYLYMLTKREHAHRGLEEGGYITYDENNHQKNEVGIKIYDFDAARSFIDGQLDSTDRAFLEMAEKFFNETATKIKYDADMKILGYTNNQEGYYVPIIRDRYSRMANVTDQRQSIGSIVTVYNKSFNQNLVENAKALEGKNIMEIINDHADGLADYSELYLPLKSFDRVYNTRVITDKAQATSIRKVLNTEVWKGSDNYFKNLFADIQGQSGERGVMNSIVGKLRSGWVNSVLGLNLKVVATQTTSYVAANQVIEMKYLAPALAKFVGNQSELGARADEYSDIIEARSFEMGALKAQGNIDTVAKWGEKSGFMINWMDRRVCLAIFHAAELKAEAEGAGAVGTVENATAAAKIADEVIYTTQAMTSKAERSALQRSKNEVAKTLSMFTSDSVKQLSHFYGNLMRYFAHKERAKTDASYEASLKADAKKVGRSATTLVMTGIMLGLITQAFKYLYAKEEEEPEDKVKDLAIDIVSSTLNILPIVSDVMDKFVHGYDISLNVFDIANDTIEDTSKLFNMAGKAMSGEYVSNAEVGKNVINAVKTYGTVLGVPIAPVERTVTGLLRRFVPSAIYGYDAMFSNPSYTSDLKKAVESGDEQLADHILTQLYKSEVAGVYTAEELELVANLYSKGYTGVIPQRIGETVNDVKLNKKQRREFEKIYSEASGKVTEMISTDEFKALSEEQQAKAIKSMYTLYYNRAASTVAGKEISNAQIYSWLTDNYSALFISQAYKSGLESIKNESGKEVSVKDQFVEYAQNLGLSESDYVVISYANSVRDKATRSALIEHINSLALTEEQKAQIAAKLSLDIKDGKVVEKTK